MDITDAALMVFDFIKIWIPVTLVALVLYKIFSPIRRKFAERYDFSWIKSTIIINFLAIFFFILAVYVIFMAIGAFIAPVRDPELEYNLLESLSFVAVSSLRIALSAFILSMILVFFEMLSSLFMDYFSTKQKASSKKKSVPSLLHQFLGILVASAIFLILFLFVFYWAPMGFFVFIFYGGVGELPLLLLFW